MTREHRARIDALGFIWDAPSDQWEHGLNYLRIYNAREGHSRVPSDHAENGFPLGTWVHHRRRSQNEMPAERRQQLNELKFVWNPFETDWIEGFHHLTKYEEREGHCLVPDGHKEDGYPLGGWVRKQRLNRKKMSAERRDRLEQLGFVWERR
jgi:hypothetical protein